MPQRKHKGRRKPEDTRKGNAYTRGDGVVLHNVRQDDQPPCETGADWGRSLAGSRKGETEECELVVHKIE